MIKKEEDHLTLQADLKHLEECANKWGMRFNTKKCYVLSINNKSSRYYQLEKHTLTIVINGKIHKNKRKRFYSSNKEGLIWGTL
jgi:archaellum component FlaG (FlaF/FlaG flagellin family)